MVQNVPMGPGASRELQPSFPPPLCVPHCGTTRLQKTLGRSQLLAGATASCWLPEKGSALGHHSPVLAWASRIKILVLKKKLKLLKPLTSSVVLHHITRKLQCNYWLTELGQCGCMRLQIPLKIRNVQNAINYKVIHESLSHVVPV